MNNTRKYHRGVGFPVNVLPQLWVGLLRPEYSTHAQAAARDEGLCTQDLPFELQIKRYQIVEIEVENAELVKQLVRVPFRCGADLCIALKLDSTGRLIAKTLWLQETCDAHSVPHCAHRSRRESGW